MRTSSYLPPIVRGFSTDTGPGGGAWTGWLSGTGFAGVVRAIAPPAFTAATICSTSPAASARGVWRLMPSVPLSCVMPLPDSNRIVLRRPVMFVAGSLLGLPIHDAPSNFGCSTTPTNHSCSFGGRTVTRKIRPPPPSDCSALLLEL